MNASFFFFCMAEGEDQNVLVCISGIGCMRLHTRWGTVNNDRTGQLIFLKSLSNEVAQCRYVLIK